MTPPDKETIGLLEFGERLIVYRRSNGETWVKLSSSFHIQVDLKLTDDGQIRWVGFGIVEDIDPDEEVERIGFILCSADE